ncbi:MAG: hypothetical protein HZB77_10805 [Chloroflexi bacterium]|nr:hypothetical protein [Chloroflexota bacterium]
MQRLFRNASVVMAGFVVANLLGLLRQIIINRAFGTSAELDAYFAAFRVPDLLFNILAGGALGSAFIPLFAEFIEKNDHPHAWRLAIAITNNLLIALSLIATVAATAVPLDDHLRRERLVDGDSQRASSFPLHLSRPDLL